MQLSKVIGVALGLSMLGGIFVLASISTLPISNNAQPVTSDEPRAVEPAAPATPTPEEQLRLYREAVGECAYKLLVQTGQIVLPSGQWIQRIGVINSAKELPLQGQDFQTDCEFVAQTTRGYSAAIDSIGR